MAKWLSPQRVLVSIFLCLLCCFALVPAKTVNSFLTRLRRQATEDPEAEKGNANEFIDDLFSNSKDFLTEQGLDPFKIGQVEICSDCVLAGLSTIRRVGDATLSQEKTDVVADVQVAFGLIRGSCFCTKKIVVAKVSGVVSFVLRDLTIHTKLRIVITPEADIKPQFDEFEVTDTGELDVYWEGRGVLGKIVQPVFNLFRRKIARTAQRFMPSFLKAAVTNNIDKVSQLIKF